MITDEDIKEFNKFTNDLLHDLFMSTCNTTSEDKTLDDTTLPSYTLTYYIFEICHGCKGKGWVNCEGIAQKCPVCDGEGKISLKIGKETIEIPTNFYVGINKEDFTNCRSCLGNMCH